MTLPMETNQWHITSPLCEQNSVEDSGGDVCSSSLIYTNRNLCGCSGCEEDLVLR
jgi:hypothetical protein